MMKLLFASAGLAALTTIPAIAQTAPTPSPPASPAPQVRIMHMADKTQVRAEVAAKVREHFAKLDANRDGFITRAESDAARQHLRGGMEGKGGERRVEKIVRKHGDGTPVRDRGAMFDRIDTNKDGMISRQEFAAAPQRSERRVVIMPRGARGGMMGGFHGRMFEMADANRDGRVSLQEATEAALRRFDSADLNRDGQLTPDERRQHRQQMRGQRRPG